MGLFDNLLGQREIALTPQGGLLLAAITMVAADGSVDDDELAVIRRLDGSQSTTAWETALKAYRSRTSRECVALATSAMDVRQRRAAMANLVDIAMADGELAGAEKQLLEEYVAAFGLNADEVSKMVDVIAVKNNRAVFA